MKKLLLSIASVIMIGGCTEVPKDMSHVDVFTNDRYLSTAYEFNKLVDDTFKYPYSNIPFLMVTGGWSVSGPKEPISQIVYSCLASNEVQLVTKYKLFMPEVTYIKTPENQVKNCIIKHSNGSINADALNDLKAFTLFQKYSDNPFLRKTVDAAKADGKISVKEYMDIVQNVIKLSKADEQVQLEKPSKSFKHYYVGKPFHA